MKFVHNQAVTPLPTEAFGPSVAIGLPESGIKTNRSLKFPWSTRQSQAAICRALAVFCLAVAPQESRAELGLAREAFGVWDREGLHSVADYPYARGQSLSMPWAAVHKSYTGNYAVDFDWTDLNLLLASADAQNQSITCSISPIGGLGAGQSMPSWMFGPLTATGGGLVAFSEVADPTRPTVIPAPFIYAKYTEPQFKVYFEAAVKALAYKVRYDPATPESQRARIAFVRVDTGATGDEEPYENPSLVPPAYYISPAVWDEYRDWVFELYRKEFQEGPGRPIPLLFSAVEPAPGAPNLKWNWIVNNVKGGFGTKHGGQIRGHHLSESESNVTVYKPLAVDSDFKFFSRNEMDPTWTKPYFALNVPLNMYWAALEQLNVGMSIWDWNGTCMENADGTLKQFFDNGNFVFTGEFFNKWAAELDPATAGGGFCVFHEGLDSSDVEKFPTGSGPGKYGNASWGNTARYTAICAAYAAQGAQMDDLNGATLGSVAQRDDNPGMIGFNDAGWKIHSGNYDRFITQLDPDNTSKALWRVGGPLTTTSHAYDRFARRSDTASGKNTMYFDINDNLLPSIGQRVQINVTYRNDTAGQFLMKYDAVGNTLKTLTVNKTGLGTGNAVWATASFDVTDWVFGNRQPTNTAPSGSDLQLVNVGPGDTIYHGIELIKIADISVGIIGSGTVTGRNNTAVFSPLPTSVMEAQRMELKANPAPGWRFTGWSGALTGTTPNPFLFPTKDTRLTATFTYGLGGSADNFNLVTWADGSGWSDTWTSGTNSSGAVALLSVPAAMAQLNGGSGIAKITRTLDTPLTNATLSFDWDLDRIGSNDFATVEVYNNSTWIQVWRQTSAGTDLAGTPNLTSSGNLTLTGTISQVRFTLSANQNGDTFFIDNVSLTGTPVIAPSIVPLFSSDPIAKTSATAGSAYLGTLSGNASDPNSNPLTFSKLPGGPAWLSVASNGSLFGTPAPTDAGINRWTVQVSSTGGSDTAILLIDVVAPGPNPPSALTYPSLPVYTKGTAIANVIPTSSGGSVLRYVATPRLPKGLYLNSTTGSISGTPSEVSATATYAITATNTDGATTANVVITVNDIVPSTLIYSSNPANYTSGTAIPANTPSNSGGVVISYAVSPALPAGLALSASTGIISGTPSVPSPTTLYTVTATNTGGSTTAQVSIAIDSLGPLTLAYSTNPVIYTKGTAIANNTPSNSGGAVVSYSVSPALPAGLTLSTATGFINGTPTAITPSANYIVTATNANGSTTASLTITVNDAPPSAMTYSNNPAVYTVGTALTNTTRSSPTNSGGAVVSYSVTPALPAGLSLNPTTTSTTFGATRGTPSAASPTTVYTVTATNTGGSTTATLTITVNAVATSAPTNLTYSSNPVTYTIGTVITPNTPTSGGGTVASYLVSPALPAGLTLDTTTGIISGTPTAISATATYTVTATNTFGSTSASVSITVNGIAPSTLVYSSNPATYNKNTAITNNTPTSGGGAVASYAVTPTLPVGLTLNTSTGVISGTPTAVVPTATYTVTATNSFGSTTASVSITVSDTILTYSNSSLITIRDNNTALPYPSTITVPTTAGTTAKVTVQLNGFNHTYPGDVAMLLVGPSGQKFLLMYHKGAGTDAVNANLGFADSASATLPSAIVSGTYKPSAYSSGTYTFPSPAPAYPYLSGALSTFNGTNPTGTWSLYTRDDANGDSGTLSGGWSLSFEITPPAVAAPSALSYSSNPATYAKGTAIANNTPASSGGAVVTYAVSPALPAGLALSTSTGVISGTPTAVTSTSNYIVTATNTSGSTTALVSITVNDAAPSALSYSTNPASYLKDSAILSNTPTSSGGSVVSYAVSPALPTGLVLDTNTGVISGTPTAATPAANYTVTASNSGGTTTALVSIAVYDAVTTLATSGTWICPSGVTLIQVECWGGGGAGGLASRNGQISNTACGGGGAGGAYAKLNSYPVTPGVTYFVNVGAGGVSASTDTTQVPGGDSWFNSVNSPSATIIAKGGAGGETVLLQSAANRFGAGGTGTAGGSVGDVVNAGGSGVATTASGFGGGGGGSAGSGNTSGGNPGVTPGTNLGLGAVAVSNGIGGNGGNGGISGSGSGLSPTASPGGGGGGARCGSASTFNGGTGAAGQVVLTVINNTTPGAPTNVSATPGNAQATLSFTAPASNGGAAITGYTVTSIPAGGTDINAGTTALSHTITGLTNGTAYTFTVTATNSVGTGAASSASSPVTPATVATVTTPTSASITGTSATLGGNVTNDGGATVTERGVVFAPSTTNGNPQIGGAGVITLPGTGTTGVFTVSASSLTPGTSYNFAAYATNGQGTSYTTTDSFITLSNDASLSALAISAASLIPSFTSGTISYTASVPSTTTSTTLTPTVTQANATVTVIGATVTSGSASDSIALSPGSNTIATVVTAQDGITTQAYTITVNVANAAPSGLTYTSNPATYTTGTAIANNTPTSSGGAVVSYSVSPALPAGLTLNTSTGVISGTPTAVTTTASYTVTATNSGGTTPASVSIAVVSPYTAWSTQYNLVQGPDGDDDGDGNSNYFEFVAGLVPTNAVSVFKTTATPVPDQPNQMAIVCSPIVSGRTYTVKSSGSLEPATWIPLSGATSSDNRNERTVIDTAATEATKFYRIEISMP